ncbi:MAG: S8 family serine peptidase [Gaiellales bacterium]
MRRIVPLPLLAAVIFLAAAAPTPALATSSAACSTPAPGTMSCFARVLAEGFRPAIASTLSRLPAGYGPQRFHRAYSLPNLTPRLHGTSGSRKKQTIAIVDAYSSRTAFADLTHFDATFGLPVFPRCTRTITSACFQAMNQSGGTKLPRSAVPYGWDVEIALDVQVAHEICQNCRILLVEATSASFANLGKAVNTAVANGANVVSNSYGSYGADSSIGGTGPSAYDHPGHAIVAAGGDSGFGPSYPADLNTVVAVGGTSLRMSGNTYMSETTWNSSAKSATGSGCDTTSLARTWQKAVSTWAAVGCGIFRGMNDVSADADPNTGAAVYNSAGARPGWIQVGGTSLSAPLIAGAYALAANSGTVTYPASLAYAHPGALHDITSAGNLPGTQALPCTVIRQCTARAGYDLPTGLGTPHGLAGF